MAGAAAPAWVLVVSVVLIRLRGALLPLFEQLVLDHLRVVQVVLVEKLQRLLGVLPWLKEAFIVAVVAVNHGQVRVLERGRLLATVVAVPLRRVRHTLSVGNAFRLNLVRRQVGVANSLRLHAGAAAETQVLW